MLVPLTAGSLAKVIEICRHTQKLIFEGRAFGRPIGSRIRGVGWGLVHRLNLDRTRRRLNSPNGTAVTLTDGEFDLLVAFAEHPQIVLSREQLLDLARGRAAIPFDRSVDVQVGRLRKKIEVNPDEPELIKAVRARGYVFTSSVEGV